MAYDSNTLTERLNRKLKWFTPQLLSSLGSIPLMILAFEVMLNRLGGNPTAEIISRLGMTAFGCFVLGLAMVPITVITKVQLAKFEAPLLKLALAYAAVHAMAWVILDRGMVWSLIWRDLTTAPSLWMGGVCLATLALIIWKPGQRFGILCVFASVMVLAHVLMI